MKNNFIPKAVFAIACGAFPPAGAVEPPWWTLGEDKVIAPGASPDAFSYANVGQGKWMAKCALSALKQAFPSLGDLVEADLVGVDKPVASWSVPSPGSPEAEAQYSPLLSGQVKAIAAPFYDYIQAVAPDWLEEQMDDAETLQFGSYYPWSASTADDDHHGVASQGQLKAAFSLDFLRDGEDFEHSDGLPDLWEYGLIEADGGVNWSHPDDIDYTNALAAATAASFDLPEISVAMDGYAQVAERIDGLSASTSLALYTTQTHAPTLSDPHGVYVRNTNFWAADIVQQLTCISPANSNGITPWNQRGGTAITTRHLISTDHLNYHIQVGDEVRFVTANDVVVHRTAVATRAVPGVDFHLILLDDYLPGSITPCKIPPADFYLYMPLGMQFQGNKPGVLGLMLDQEEKGLVGAWHQVSEYYASYTTPLDATALDFHEGLVSGDSGNPGFMIINGELVLLTVWTSGGSNPVTGYGNGAGAGMWRHIDAINDTIEDLDADAGISTGLTVSTVSLSGFSKVNPTPP